MKAKCLFRYLYLFVAAGLLAACGAPGGELPTQETPADTPVVGTPEPEATPTMEPEPTATEAAETPTTEVEATETPPAGEGALSGTSWTLQSFGPEGSETPALEDTTLTLIFDSPMQLGGSGGCNSYGADYSVENGALQVGHVVSTLMACADEAVNEQEANYYAALQTAGEFEVSGDELTIWYDDGASVMHFTRSGDVADGTPPAEEGLVGTEWELESFGPAGDPAPVVEGSTVTLAFEADNVATGSGGCNSYGGEYQIEGSIVAFFEVVSTQVACEDEAVMEQEQAYFEALRTTETYTQTADSLSIQFDEGQGVLNFVALSPDSEGGLPDDAEATRIEFAAGETSAQVEATIEENDTHYYVLSAMEGQQMTVEIRSPNDDVVLTIVSQDGMPIKRYQNGPPASWSGELPETQDYYIYAISFGPDTTYTLDVEIEAL